MKDRTGEQLIRDLLADPRRFDDNGRAYDLLQAYFDGLSLETLRPLLKHQDAFVQRAATFVGSELGREASSLVDDVIPLVRSADRRVAFCAIEILAVCCKGPQAEKFAHVIRMLESDDDVLRGLAMRLVSRVDVATLHAARRGFEAADSRDRTHADGLQILTAGDRLEPTAIAAMIHDADPLVRRYGAIAIKRGFPSLALEVGSSEDGDLRKFYQWEIRSGS